MIYITEESNGEIHSANKDRTECCDDHFPCNKEECDRNHVSNWLKLFILYLHIGTDRFQLMGFLMESG